MRVPSLFDARLRRLTQGGSAPSFPGAMVSAPSRATLARIAPIRTETSPGRQEYIYSLPDQVAAMLGLRDSDFPTVSLIVPTGAGGSDCGEPEPGTGLSVLTLDWERFFIPALFERETGQGVCAYRLWVRIDQVAAQLILEAIFHERQTDRFPVPGLVASLVRLDRAVGERRRFGLHGDVSVELAGIEVPRIIAGDGRFSPFPSLYELPERFYEPVSPDEERETIETCEQLLRLGDAKAASDCFLKDLAGAERTARTEFLRGQLMEDTGMVDAARHAFHEAYLLDHPQALARELQSLSTLSKPFRDRYPDVFDDIRSGNRFHALTTLRQAVRVDPLFGNAILAYCLRGAHEDAEGLQATSIALAQDPLQADVWGARWSFLTELRRDEEARQVAFEHLRHYPLDQVAVVNLIDSSLLSGNVDEARFLVRRYAILSVNVELTLRQQFKLFEHTQDWARAEFAFETVATRVVNPGIETLQRYGEVLVERERFDDAFAAFDKAMQAAPGNGDLVLGYARAFARADREADAEQLLKTVLADPNRIDDIAQRAFLLTLLAEILRRTGRAEAALNILEDEFDVSPATLAGSVGPIPGLEHIDTLLACGLHDRAKEELEILARTLPDDPLVREYLEAMS